MKLELTEVDNGYILKINERAEVFEMPEIDDTKIVAQSFARILRVIIYEMGPQSVKDSFGYHNIKITIEPGDEVDHDQRPSV